ncbi:MAG TPA: hypothetical protein HPP87_10675 [Planctomycetes bacterium]|nr:hypothetical protein [Planctomycetota bacterium]HIJ71810.1 hypothetical protein [Planctomycetota bacterium]
MKTFTRSVAITFAVSAFFVMAIVGWCSGLSPATCCSRAVTGAIITYIALSWAAKGVMSIIINEIVQSRINKTNQKDKQ